MQTTTEGAGGEGEDDAAADHLSWSRKLRPTWIARDEECCGGLGMTRKRVVSEEAH